MKRTLLFIFSISFIGTLYANPKLIDLNREWLYQKDINVRQIKNVPESEVEKIKMHLRLVEKTLRNRSVQHLSKTQQLNRLKCLDILNAYWKKGVFPQNEMYAYRTPIFIDQYNTFCAVGHLMKETGSEEIAREISKKNNLIYVREIINQRAAHWIKNSGLTMEECAWIQPGYPPPGDILDLSGLSPTTPIINRSIPLSLTQFSATMTTTGSIPNAITDSGGNVFFGLGSGTEQCIHLTFNGSFDGLFLSAIPFTGGIDSNDSVRVNMPLNPTLLADPSFNNLFYTNYMLPYTEIRPHSNPSASANWNLQFDNPSNSSSVSICVYRSSSSSSTNNSFPIVISGNIPNIAVPVHFTDFILNPVSDGLLVKWETAREFNINNFVIEHSTDGVDWSEIGIVKSKGNSSTRREYTFMDIHPRKGRSWYRIKSVDLNNDVSYSYIKSIYVGSEINEINVTSPNPVQDRLTIEVTDPLYLEDKYGIYNGLGQEINCSRMILGNLLEFDVSQLATGMYFLYSDYLKYKFIKK